MFSAEQRAEALIEGRRHGAKVELSTRLVWAADDKGRLALVTGFKSKTGRVTLYQPALRLADIDLVDATRRLIVDGALPLKEWDEGEHPRDDDGKFADDGGGDDDYGGGEGYDEDEGPAAPSDISFKLSRKLTDDEQAAVANYTFSAPIYNAIMRGQTKGDDGRKFTEADYKEAHEQIALIKSAISASTIKKAVPLFRGVGKEFPRKFKVGQTIDQVAFSSTSTDKRIASNFSQHNVVLKIATRKGMHAVEANPGGPEGEIILGPGSFKIRGVKEDAKGVKVVSVLYKPEKLKSWEEFEREWDESEHPRDDDGKFADSGGGESSGGASSKGEGLKEILQGQSLDALPPEARTEKGAENSFYNKLLSMPSVKFYHETPGDVADSVKSKGIEGGYGVFARIGKPSDFVTSEVKTITEFKMPKARLREVVPDMVYGTYEGDIGLGGKPVAELSPFQHYLLNHPDIVGGDVSTGQENIPTSWIIDVSVVGKSTSPEARAKELSNKFLESVPGARIASKAGASHGPRLQGGTIWHAIEQPGFTAPALCGARPAIDWAEASSDAPKPHVTCPRCLTKLEKRFEEGKSSKNIVVYHGSWSNVVDSVKQNGLTIRGNKRSFEADEYAGERGQSVFVSKDLGEARGWPLLSTFKPPTDKVPVVFEVHIPAGEAVKLKDDEYRGGDGTSYRFVGVIPPEWITGYSIQDQSTGKWSSFKKLKQSDEVFYITIVTDNPGNEKTFGLLREWDESEHPRDDDGKFAEGGGGSEGSTPDTSAPVDEVSGGTAVSSFLKQQEEEMQVRKNVNMDVYKDELPNINVDRAKVLGPRNMGRKVVLYNCIGGAMGDHDRWWFPSKDPNEFFWPSDSKRGQDEKSFDDLFIRIGKGSETKSEKVEEGYVKVAIFKFRGKVSHAARLLPNGQWLSKMGAMDPLMHDLEDFKGNKISYGNVAKIYKVPLDEFVKIRSMK